MSKQEDIVKAAAKLFAEQSYTMVGIRSIAKEAGVNSAMISYYFGGKQGLLREIFSRFKRLNRHVLETTLKASSSLEEMCRESVSLALESARKNRDIYLVGLKVMNQESLGLQDLRQEMDDESWSLFSEFLDRIGVDKEKSRKYHKIAFTVIMGMIFSDYLLGGGEQIHDQNKSREYEELVIEIMTKGTPGFLT